MKTTYLHAASLTGVLLLGLSPVSFAAKLNLIEQHYAEYFNGELVTDQPPSSLRATPTEIEMSIMTGAAAVASEDNPDSTAMVMISSFSLYLIEPEGGEEIGDPVCYTYLFESAVEASASGDHAAAAAATGREDIDLNAHADATVPEAWAEAQATDNYIVVTAPDEQTRVFGQHAALMATAGTDDFQTNSGHFVAYIGDTLQSSIISLSASAAAYPGQASAEAANFARIELVDCTTLPPVAINSTISGPGQIAISPEQAEYFPGDEITLAAIPTGDSRFIGWAGDASGTTNPLTIVLEGDVEISGQFMTVVSVPLMSRPGTWLLMLTLLGVGLWFGSRHRQA